MKMSLQMMKRSMSRMLKQSIIDLCKNSVGAEGYVEIDGIVCITIGDEEVEEIVVKVHEVIEDTEEHYMPPRSMPPTSHTPTRNQPQQPQQAGPPGRPRMPLHHNMPHMGGRGGHAGSPGRHQSQGPVYSQAGGPPHRGMGPPQAGHHGPSDQFMHRPGMKKNQQEMQKKMQQQQQQQQQMMDGPVIKIEIDSDDDHSDNGPSPKGAKKGPPFICNVCDQTLPNFKQLKGHVKDMHNAVVCEVCWTPFSTKADLDAHMKTHDKSPQQQPGSSPRHDGAKAKDTSGANKYKCGVCGNMSDNRKTMVEHLRNGHEFQGCYTCMLCREYFPNKPTFTIHRKLSHAAAKDVTCQTCGVGLEQKEYENHRVECTEEEKQPKGKGKNTVPPSTKGPAPKRARMDPPQAPVTRSSKKSPSNSNPDKKECPICCVILDNFIAYERHVSTVHNRIVCSVCAGTLKNGRAAAQHMKRHTEKLPFNCDICSIGNQSLQELRRHMVVAHKHQPAYFTCPQCNLFVTTRHEFSAHMRDTHKVDFIDDDELENYVVFEEDEEDEYNDEDEEEEYMGEGFNHGEYGMDDHQYGTGEPDELVTCNICELAMPSLQGLKEHIHSVHNAVVCESCWRPFLSQSELENHIKTAHCGDNTPKDVGKKSPVSASSASAAAPKSGNSSTTHHVGKSSGNNANINANAKKGLFKCGVCGEFSDSRKAVKQHLKAAHEYIGCYTCFLCGEFFPNKPTYSIHRKLSHETANEATCSTCGVGLMKTEVDQHQEECENAEMLQKAEEEEGKKEGKQDK